jgi:hypothetical protein
MSEIPDDFGGFIGYWLDGHAHLVRYGQGKPIEGVSMTPLNALQARKLLDGLIETGVRDGQITDEHVEQSRQLPRTEGLDDVPPRSEVDKIAGPD